MAFRFGRPALAAAPREPRLMAAASRTAYSLSFCIMKTATETQSAPAIAHRRRIPPMRCAGFLLRTSLLACSNCS